MASIVRWGMVGCGDVTERKSGPAFQSAERSRLVAVASRTPARAHSYAQRHGVARAFDDPHELIASRDVDAVYVATPPSSHLEFALAAARAAKPAYVEKPMALDRRECERMIEAFRAAGVPLFVAYYRRALPRFQKIAALVRDGAIGEVRVVRIALSRTRGRLDPSRLPWRVRPELAGGGHFVDLACHTLDFLDYALGPIADVAGLAGNQSALYPAEDVVCAALRFESGAFAAGAWSFDAASREDLVEIVGSAGVVRFATFDERPIELERRGQVEAFAIANPEAIQLPLVQSAVDHVLGLGRCPSTGDSAARTTFVIDEVLRAYRDSSRVA